MTQLILEEEREAREKLENRVEVIDQNLNEREKLEPRIAPILSDQVVYLQKKFPELFGPAITASIKNQIKDSKDEVVEALYPIMGKMVKKYILKEIELLSERIDQKIEEAFSWDNWVNFVKAKVFGIKQGDMILKDAMEPVIQEVFIIEQHSGMLIGSYSRVTSVDQDMVAGMLTAIKSFAKDTFSIEDQELETIEYENYKIVIKNFPRFYIAVVISGIVSKVFLNRLDDLILDFVDKVINQRSPKAEADFIEEEFSENLNDYFIKLNQYDK
ncbi:cell envelope biogenesis protein OmpA [Flexithrix dorotheae]|uniref:cell envelope biogenesis protein OmpA n=1 Tax=Flexithrix dorotheae TaxID=70993 RepID=UPI00146BA727|nr:cell envelope biogenesis protein OmpA [Flexithrix dorotheae]